MEKADRLLQQIMYGTRAHFSVLVSFIFSHVKKKNIYIFSIHSLFHITVTCQDGTTFLALSAALYGECAVVLSTPCSSVLTSKQYSCPRMLEWTGLMMASSSRVRSSASAALLGDSKDSWEWDSLKLCIKRVLRGVIVVVRCEGGITLQLCVQGNNGAINTFPLVPRKRHSILRKIFRIQHGENFHYSHCSLHMERQE